VNKQAAFLIIFALLPLWSGCAETPNRNTPTPAASFETLLAPATAAHPRQSEGDVVVLKDGRLLAAWSEFSGQGEDHSRAEIVAATSRDGGHSWTPPSVLQPNIAKDNVMSVSLLRSRSGDILFFFLAKNSASDLKVWLRRSTDEARTWSEPLVVTPEPGYHIMNNARVAQLKSGRLLCPISTCADIEARGWHLRNVVCFSDDDGRTWRRGKGLADCPKRGAMEPGLVELKDGKVLQVIRTQMGQIWFSLSPDGGDTWSEAAPLGVAAPESPSTIARLPGNGALVLIYNPSIAQGVSGMKSRTPLVSSISRDEGRTWSKPKVIEPSLEFTYAYTSLTFDSQRALLTYYVAPASITGCSLKFRSIPLSWFSAPDPD
jgi:sialidase-1